MKAYFPSGVVRLVIELLFLGVFGGVLSLILGVGFGWDERQIWTYLSALTVVLCLWAIVGVVGIAVADSRRHTERPTKTLADLPGAEVIGVARNAAKAGEPVTVDLEWREPPIGPSRPREHGRRAKR